MKTRLRRMFDYWIPPGKGHIQNTHEHVLLVSALAFGSDDIATVMKAAHLIQAHESKTPSLQQRLEDLLEYAQELAAKQANVLPNREKQI